MARGGINKAVVQKARTTLLARGEYPSIDAVRVELGNTGSKTTIHRYLKELEAADSGRGAVPLALSEQLTNLVNQLADQLQEEAQAVVAGERELLERERIDYQQRIRQAESRIQQLEGQTALDAERFQATDHELQQLRELRQQAEIENARLQQANRDLEERLKDRDTQIHSLEEKHRHARDALEHYRQASKEQREQEQRRHESQAQQLKLEIRQRSQTLPGCAFRLFHSSDSPLAGGKHCYCGCQSPAKASWRRIHQIPGAELVRSEWPVPLCPLPSLAYRDSRIFHLLRMGCYAPLLWRSAGHAPVPTRSPGIDDPRPSATAVVLWTSIARNGRACRSRFGLPRPSPGREALSRAAENLFWSGKRRIASVLRVKRHSENCFGQH